MNADLLQPDELADAVVHMDDEIADFEIAEVRQERAARGAAPLQRPSLLLEEIGFRKNAQVPVREIEPTGDSPGRDQHRGTLKGVGVGHRSCADLVVREELNRPFGASGRRGHEDHAVASDAGASDLFHPVRDPSVVRRSRQRCDVGARKRPVVQCQFRRLASASYPTVEIRPGHGELFIGRNRSAARDQVFGRRPPLALQRPGALVDFLRLVDEQPRARPPRVVGKRRRTVGAPGIVGAIQRQQFSLGQDADAVERGRRSLRRRVEPANRLDDVADELEPDRLAVAGGKDVDDAAAQAELPMLVDRIFRRKPCRGQPTGQVARRNLLAWCQREAGRRECRGLRQPREKRAGRRHDEPNRSGRQAVQCGRPGRRHLEMRQQSAIRIDLRRWKWANRQFCVGLGQPFKVSQEEAGVRHHLIDEGVGRHNEHHRAVLGRQRRVQRHHGRRDPGQDRTRPIETGPGSCALQQRSKRQGRRMLEHRDWPASGGRRFGPWR
jgi:hypothetical protein